MENAFVLKWAQHIDQQYVAQIVFLASMGEKLGPALSREEADSLMSMAEWHRCRRERWRMQWASQLAEKEAADENRRLRSCQRQ